MLAMKHLTDEQLNEYLDGQLSPAGMTEATRHLATCDACQAHLAALQTLFTTLSALPDLPLASDLSGAVLANLPRLDRHKPRCGPVRKSTVGKKRAWSLIGVHVLIGLHFLHWWLFGETVTPLEPSEAMQTVELGRLNAGFLLFADGVVAG